MPEEWESVDRKLMVLVAERGEVESTCILLREFFCRFSGVFIERLNFLGDNKESGWGTLSVMVIIPMSYVIIIIGFLTFRRCLRNRGH